MSIAKMKIDKIAVDKINPQLTDSSPIALPQSLYCIFSAGLLLNFYTARMFKYDIKVFMR